MNRDRTGKGGKTILVYIYPEWAAYYSAVPLLRDLDRRGHRIVCLGPAGFADYIGGCGFEYRQFDIFEYYQQKKSFHLEMLSLKYRKLPGRLRGFRVWPGMNRKIFHEMVRDMEEMIAADRPHLVLLGPLMFPFSLPFHKLNLPIINLNFTLISPCSSLVPPVFSGIIPDYRSGWLYRVRNILAWTVRIGRQMAYELYGYKELACRLTFSYASFLYTRKELRKYGAAYRRTDYFPRLQVPELVTCPREFDFPRLPRSPSRCYTGSCVDTKRPESPFNWQGIDRDKPIAYCTLGSYSRTWKYRKRLFGAVIQSFARKPDWHLIIQVADDEDIAPFGPLPANVTSARWVPHLEVLSHTDVMICHGGFSTVREAVYFGVPLIIFPCDRDQPGYAARIVFHRLGVRGNIKKVGPLQIDRLVERIVSDSSIRQSVERMQQVFREQESCSRGVEFIEKYLEPSS